MKCELKTLYLGKEYDENLLKKLDRVLCEKGAVLVQKESAVVGSQDLIIKKMQIGDQYIDIESETYIGTRITGPKDLVEAIAQLLKSSSPVLK